LPQRRRFTVRAQELLADDAQPMLRPEEYTLPGTEAAQLPTEQEYMAETVKQAREGNTEASREILSAFIATVDRHTENTWPNTIPWSCARFVADKLRALLKGEPGDAVVPPGTKSGRADKPTGGVNRHIAVAGFYFLLVRAGVAPKAAKSLMNSSIGVSDDVIEGAVKQYPGFQYRDRFTVEILVELAATYRGKIAEIIAARKLRLS